MSELCTQWNSAHETEKQSASWMSSTLSLTVAHSEEGKIDRKTIIAPSF